MSVDTYFFIIYLSGDQIMCRICDQIVTLSGQMLTRNTSLVIYYYP